MNRRYWLSIDYDFFVREDYEWGWQHAEAPFFRDGLAWLNRAAALVAAGLVPEEFTRQGAETHDAFFDKLQASDIRLDGAKLVVSDSHSFAYTTFAKRVMPRPPAFVDIVSFDAHHDLGYNEEVVHRNIRSGEIACDDWLLHLLIEPSTRVRTQIVYPGWKGMTEWHDARPIDSLRLIAEAEKTVREPVTFDALRLDGGDVEVIHVCRSGGWTPPWHDKDFIEFVRRLERRTGKTAMQPYADVEALDVLRPRDWDDQQMRAMADNFKLVQSPEWQRISDELKADHRKREESGE